MRVVTDSARYLLGYLKEWGELRCELRIASLPRPEMHKRSKIDS